MENKRFVIQYLPIHLIGGDFTLTNELPFIYISSIGGNLAKLSNLHNLNFCKACLGSSFEIFDTLIKHYSVSQLNDKSVNGHITGAPSTDLIAIIAEFIGERDA